MLVTSYLFGLAHEESCRITYQAFGAFYPESQVAVSGSMPGGVAVQTNDGSHGGVVCGLDPAVHCVEW